MQLNDLETRNDIIKLITIFYSKVRKDSVLGPIFNGIINDWENHIIHIADFWNTNLFSVPAYKGNPISKHIEVDKKQHHTINNEHFGIWLRLWITTIDELFEGKIATLAKDRARRMATIFFIKIFENQQNVPKE
ncbi:group III truncated hemoglobin [Aquimarina sp. 2-A2]|uniref:group III truncated hemoglobin n=1 Tax=Aquimarina sp. 2-A2 TaxID=3382644 RepID=UPI00387EE917